MSNQPPPIAPNPFQCPKCSSDHTQKLSVIYDSGTTNARSKTFAHGVAINPDLSLTPVLGSLGTNTLSQSELARRLSPPVLPSKESGEVYFVHFVAIAAVCVSFGLMMAAVDSTRAATEKVAFIIGIVFFLGFGIVFAIYGFSLDKTANESLTRKLGTYQKHLADWRASVFCHRCGHVYIPESLREKPQPRPSENQSTGRSRAKLIYPDMDS